ncbi:histidine kinase [Pseudoflavitalea sp. G-6-1-2]|uniref:sensor histidine kinase n=1 Tax=Pseudoflavitalea sp. G-6-1-2 TaxID=2728841 RepID=UPI00146D2612|nr:histidine kinase [Pseudoflavitalea sp. G-6-1-2]NML23807.1 histidine kinase [Pseudoflavitalea sp. G-6-1-2]
MMKNFYIANNRLLTHVLFWIAYLLTYTGMHAEGEDGMRVYFIGELERLPSAMLVAYVNLYLLYPGFFATKKYWQYVVSAVLLLFASSLLNRVFIEYFTEPLFQKGTTTPYEQVFIWYYIFKGMLWFLSPVLLFTLALRIFQRSYAQEQQHQALSREKLHAELNYLKAQVHPHFFFNTLNNLYALTLQASPSAPKVVLKLSELMSYMLYDAQQATVPLTKEIEHISNYLELEKIRYSKRLDVSLNVSGETAQCRIAPLLLIPLVENAFKHGVSNHTDNVWVTIDVKVKSDWLTVIVENSYEEQPVPNKEYRNGIGLQNVEKRLSLLYSNQHELIKKKEPGRYSVYMKIKII